MHFLIELSRKFISLFIGYLYRILFSSEKMVDHLRKINQLLEEKIDEFLREKDKWETEIIKFSIEKNIEILLLENE